MEIILTFRDDAERAEVLSALAIRYKLAPESLDDIELALKQQMLRVAKVLFLNTSIRKELKGAQELGAGFRANTGAVSQIRSRASEIFTNAE